MTKDEIALIERDITVEESNGRRTITFKPNVVLFDNAKYADEAKLRIHLGAYLRRIAQYLEA